MSHVWGVPEENRLEEDRQHLFFIPGAAEWEAPGWKPSNTRTAARGPTLLISSHAIEKLGLDAGLYWTNWSWGSEAKPGWVSTQVVFVNVTLQLLVDLMNVGLVIKGNSTDLTCQCQVICYDHYSACENSYVTSSVALTELWVRVTWVLLVCAWRQQTHNRKQLQQCFETWTMPKTGLKPRWLSHPFGSWLSNPEAGLEAWYQVCLRHCRGRFSQELDVLWEQLASGEMGVLQQLDVDGQWIPQNPIFFNNTALLVTLYIKVLVINITVISGL